MLIRSIIRVITVPEPLISANGLNGMLIRDPIGISISNRHRLQELQISFNEGPTSQWILCRSLSTLHAQTFTNMG